MDDEPAEAVLPLTIMVERDSTFSRSTADEVLVIDLGRDMEFAFLQYGGRIVSQVQHSGTAEYNSDSILTEVCRVRIAAPSAFSLAMNVIEPMIRGNKIKIDNFERAIAEWIGEARGVKPDVTPNG